MAASIVIIKWVFPYSNYLVCYYTDFQMVNRVYIPGIDSTWLW